MPTARQSIGSRKMLEACDGCHPPFNGPNETLRKREFVTDVKEILEVGAAKCQDYIAGRVDDWGMDETLRALKAALRDLLNGVDG